MSDERESLRARLAAAKSSVERAAALAEHADGLLWGDELRDPEAVIDELLELCGPDPDARLAFAERLERDANSDLLLLVLERTSWPTPTHEARAWLLRGKDALSSDKLVHLRHGLAIENVDAATRADLLDELCYAILRGEQRAEALAPARELASMHRLARHARLYADLLIDEGRLDEAAAAFAASAPPEDWFDALLQEGFARDLARRRGLPEPALDPGLVNEGADEAGWRHPSDVPIASLFVAQPLDANTFPSADRIRAASHGSITRPEPLDASGRPTVHGPRCEVIFGPTRDDRCACGRYDSARYRGLVCARCHVEVIPSSTRAERCGHVTLGARIVHPLHLDAVASALQMAGDELDAVLETREGIVIDPRGEPGLYPGKRVRSEIGEALCGRGPEAVCEVLAGWHLRDLAPLKGVLPRWFVTDALPVPPPEGEVPGVRFDRRAYEAALADVLAAKDRSVELQRAARAYFACFQRRG